MAPMGLQGDPSLSYADIGLGPGSVFLLKISGWILSKLIGLI